MLRQTQAPHGADFLVQGPTKVLNFGDRDQSEDLRTIVRIPDGMPGSRARWVNETQSGADRQRRGLKFGNYPRDANTDPHLAEHDLNNLRDWIREEWGWNEDLANAVMWLDPNVTDHRGFSRERIDATEAKEPQLYRSQLPKWDARIR